MPRIAPLLLCGLAALLSGCLAKTALDIATAPVKIASKGADLATTSQSEADQNRGREIRKREERYGRLGRQREKLSEKCDGGQLDACRDLAAIEAEMRELSSSIPVEPDR